MTLIRLSGVTKTFPPQTRGAEPVVAVDDVSLAVAAGEICGIIGYSGAGKSTVLRLVNALETPSSGTVEIDGVDITGLGERELRRLRGDIGMIFQQFNLFDSRTVAGNIAYPLEVAGARAPRSAPASTSCSSSSASPPRRATTPSSSPAGRSSASASPAPSPRTRASSSPTRRRAPSTPTRRRRCSRSSAA